MKCPDLAKELGCSPTVVAAWSGGLPEGQAYRMGLERAQWFEFTPTEVEFIRERVRRWREKRGSKVSAVQRELLKVLGDGERHEWGPLKRRVMSIGGWNGEEVGKGLRELEPVWSEGRVKRADGTVEHNVLFVEVPRL